jgi:hypothetical protein
VPEPFFRVWMIYPHLDGSLPQVLTLLQGKCW